MIPFAVCKKNEASSRLCMQVYNESLNSASFCFVTGISKEIILSVYYKATLIGSSWVKFYVKHVGAWPFLQKGKVNLNFLIPSQPQLWPFSTVLDRNIQFEA